MFKHKQKGREEPDLFVSFAGAVRAGADDLMPFY